MPIFRLKGDDISNAKLILAKETNLELESYLEDWLENSPWALIQDELILWIGRQPSANVEDSTIFPDLLGIDSEGNLVIVELKRDKAPKEVVAQLLEYAAWANELSDEQIHEIAEAYFETGEEFKGKQFHDVFKNVFEIPETDEVPPLNRNLRLYIVAGDIPARVARVCRFLRVSYRIDVSCISVSLFQTESSEKIVSTEVRVGDENFPSSTPLVPDLPPRREVVREAVRELTNGDINVEFAPRKVKQIISRKYSNFSLSMVPFLIITDAVNSSAFNRIPVTERKYWRVRHGVYRLYDPDKDKLEDDSAY